MNLTSLKQKWRHRLIQALPGQLVIQMTDKCNATCPQCSMRINSNFKRHTLDKNELFKIIDAAGLKNIKALSFTGGEPLLMVDDLCECIRRAGNKGIPFIRTGTNGFWFAKSGHPDFKDKISRLADKLAATPLRNFWISMDSFVPDIHESMRGFSGVVEGIAKAIPIFHNAGIYPSVNLGINRNLGGDITSTLHPDDFSSANAYKMAVYNAYCTAFSKFYEMAIELGFTIANACYPMSVDSQDENLAAVYQASTTDHVVRFTPAEKTMIFSALNDTLEEYRHRIRIFSPRSSLNALIHHYSGDETCSSPCQGGINYFFIDSKTGNTFPCGFRGQDNFGKFYNLNGSFKPVKKDCTQCDWECFRDPSELSAPLLDLLSSPTSLTRKVFNNRGHFKLWLNDLLYYRSCGYFDGRKPPDFDKLAAFKI